MAASIKLSSAPTFLHLPMFDEHGKRLKHPNGSDRFHKVGKDIF